MSGRAILFDGCGQCCPRFSQLLTELAISPRTYRTRVWGWWVTGRPMCPSMSTVTTAPESGVEANPRRWLILALLCVAVAMIFIDETILNIVLPDLVKELGSSSAQLQWAIDAYLIVYAALLFPAGALGDRHGRRRLLVIGLSIFGVGSLIAAFAGSTSWLIFGRVVMGLGGAAMLPTTLSIVVHTFPDGERTKAIGIWAAASGIGVLIGPMLAGWLLVHFWWGSVFLVNVPLVVVALVGCWWCVPESKDPSTHGFDWTGAVLVAVGLAGVLYAIIEWPTRGVTDPTVMIAAVAGVAGLCGFVHVARRHRMPTFDVAVFRSRTVSTSAAVLCVGFAGVLGSSFAISQYIQLYQNRSAIAVAVVFGLTTIGVCVSAVTAPMAIARFGERRVIVAMVLVLAASYVLMAFTASQTAMTWLCVAATLQGVGLGGAVTPVTDRVMAELPVERSGMASALNDAARQIGAALGIAVFGSIFAVTYRDALPAVIAGPVRDNFAHATHLSDAVLAHARTALVSGYVAVMVGCAITTAAVAVLVARTTWNASAEEKP